MKIIALLLASVTLFAASAFADPPADEGAAQLIVQKLKETRPVVMLSPYVGPAYCGFLPVWTFHSEYPEGKQDVNYEYVNVGIGGKYETSNRTGKAYIGSDVNVVALSARAWNFAWANGHVKRTKLPPIFAGISYVMPLEYRDLKASTIKRDIRGMLGLKVTW